MEIVNKLINLKVKIASFFFGLSEYSFIRDGIRFFSFTNQPRTNLILFLILNLVVFFFLFQDAINLTNFFFTHTLSWDSYVYYCGSNMLMMGEDPYDYVLLRECLPGSWNFYYNMPPTLLYIYYFPAKLNIDTFILFITMINTFLIVITLRRFFKSFSFKNNFQKFIFVILALTVWDGSASIAFYTGNMGFTVSLLFLYLLLDLREGNQTKFLTFIFIATLIKPIYIIFLGSIFFYNKSLLKSVKNSLIVIFFISLAYAAQFVLDQKNSIGFLENLQNLANSSDMGFGFLKTLASVKSVEYLSLSKTMYLEISLILSIITFFVCLYFYKRNEEKIKPLRSLLVPIIILICFPRIKVYDAVFALSSICYLPILMDIKLQEKKILNPQIVLCVKILMFFAIIYNVFIYSQWEAVHFFFLPILSILVIFHLSNQIDYKLHP